MSFTPADLATRERDALRQASRGAPSLADAMPRLVMEARRISATVMHGLHGRRRAGPGENFWQFRHFTSGEAAQRIDWRRSGRDDHLYVREREWEAAHTVWIWPDRSPSMIYASPMVWETKLDRALILAFALADMLVQAGERVGIPGLMRPSGARGIIERMAEALLHDPAASRPGFPAAFPAQARAEFVLLSDFWTPAGDIAANLQALCATGLTGHLVQIVDPAEESFPFSGRIEFEEPESGERLTIGRAELWRDDYQRRIEAHRASIREAAARLGTSFAIHRTDRPASELLLALHQRMSAGAMGDRR